MVINPYAKVNDIELSVYVSKIWILSENKKVIN
jgi:hypothetical protein